jgi:hypothetical protein
MSRRNRRSRAGTATSLVIVLSLLMGLGVDPFVSTARAQQPASEPVDGPSADDDEQTLHDPASLEPNDAKPPVAADSDPVPESASESGSDVAEAAPPAEPAAKRNLLEEKLAEGEGKEVGPIAFDSDEGSFVLVTTKPHFTRLQAKNELDRLMLAAADERYQAAVHSPRVTFWFPLDLAYVRSELLLTDGEQFRQDSDGMYVGHALIAFDQAFERRLRAVRVASRSMQIVAAVGTAIALLIVAFAFLRLDRATRGLYTGRLQTWAVVACAIVACVTGFVAYWIPWI